MATITAKANWVLLNKRAFVAFEGRNVWVPLGNYAANALADALEVLGDESITVEYRTVADPKEQARDRTKYTKRVEALSAVYSASEWAPKVIDGFVMSDTFQCTLTRIVP